MIPGGAILLALGWIMALSGCGGGGGSVPPPAEVSFTIARSSNPPDAITGHAYNAFIATSLASGSAQNDVVTACTLSGSFPSGMTAAPGAPSSGAAYYCVLAMSFAPAAGQYNFTLQAADGSTPVKTASQAYALSIRPDFTFTTAALAPGVQGRAYGVTPFSQPEATNIGTTQAGLTVGNAPLTACSLVSVTPSNPGLTVGLDATKTQCLVSSPALSGAGTFTVTVSAAETQITDTVTGAVAVPAAATTPPTAALPLVVNGPLTLAVNQGSSWATGVSNRPYGSGVGCTGGACTPAVYTASGGLGGYVFPASTPASMPAGMACPAVSGSATYTCAAPAPGITAAAGTYSPSVTVADTGNTATPAATTASDPLSTRTDSLVVAAPLALSSDAAGADPPPTGVQSRTYGNTSAGFKQLVYDASGGLPAYVFTLPASIAAPGTGVPASLACASTATQASCTSGANPVTAAPGTYSFNITLDDAGNASTPKGSASSATYSFPAPKTIVINSPLTLTPPSGSLAPAVVGRSWGQGSVCASGGTSACAAAVYAVANGLGGYNPGPVAAGPLSCTFTSTGTFAGNYTCSTASEASSPPSAIVALTVADAANATTPSGSASSNTATLPIVAALQITAPATVPAAVKGRSYGSAASGCSGGACATLNYGIANGLGAYQSAATMTTAAGTFSCPLAGATYQCSSTDIAGAGGTAPVLSLSVSDTGNGSTPGGTATDSSKTLSIQAEITVTPPATVPSAVQGRAYGTGTGCSGGACQPLQYTLNNGLGNYTSAGSSLATTSDTFACTLASATFSCSKALIAATTNLTLTFTAAETGNVSTPGNTVNDTSKTLTASPEMNFTATPSSFANAVTGRIYGTGSTCGAAGTSTCTPLTYTIQSGSGLGGYNYAFSPSIGFACSSGSNTTNCTSASVGAAGSYATTHVSVTDTSNATTPNNTIASTNGTLTVEPEMNFTSAPTSPFAAAVDTRTYGQGNTCGATGTVACTPLAYAIQSNTGLGGYNYALVVNSGNGGFACTSGGTSTNCTSPSVTETAGSYAAVHAAVTDTGNASTPANTIPSANASLTVHSELTITPPASIPAAVTSRSFGVGNTCGASGTSACAPITYAITNGLGNYTGTATMTTTAGTFTCTLSGSNYQCTSPDITGSGTPTLSLAVTDTGNGSTPGNSKTDNSKTLTINPEVTVTAPASVPIAVNGRAYGTGTGCTGTGGNCAPLQYSLSNGLGNYTLTGSYLTTPLDTFTCTLALPVFSCSKASIATAGGTSPTLTFTGAETGNASTPAHSVTDTSKTLATNPGMTVTPPASVATAVHNRPFGIGTGCSGGGGACAPLLYTVANGLGNYTLTGSSLATPSDTFACTFASPTFTCSDTTITGAGGAASTLTFTGAETGNASTPGGTVVNTSQALTVNAQLAVTVSIGGAGYTSSQAWPVGVSARPYGSGTGCSGGSCVPPIYTVSGGLSGFTFSNFAGLTGMGFTCTPNVAAPNSTTLTCRATSLTSGTPSVTAVDNANVSTPVATTATDPNSILTSSLTVNPRLTLTETDGLPSPLPAGVDGRPYGGTGFTPLQYTASNGLGSASVAGSYVFTPSNLPVNLTCPAPASPNANVLKCGTQGATALPAGTSGTSPYGVTIAVDDVKNQTTPDAVSSSTAPANIVDSLPVHPVLAVTDTNYAGALPDGVVGRDYGVGTDSGCTGGDCVPPLYTASAGLGGYTFTAITTSLTPVGNAFPAGFLCGPVAPTVSTTFTCAAAPLGATDSTSSAFAPAVTLSDTANATTPSGSQNSTAQSLTLHAGLALTPDPTLSADPPPAAVINRQYGDTALSTCGSSGSATCKALVYNAAGGLGALTFGANPTSIAAPGTGVPAAVTCSHAASQETCTTGTTASNVITASAGDYNFKITVDDTANRATPDDATSSKTGTLSETITIKDPIKFNTGASCGNTDNAVCIGGVGYPASTVWPANLSGVIGRPYGSGTCAGSAACAPLIFTATNGLGAVGGYTFSNDGSLTGVGFTCNTSSPTLTCAASTGPTYLTGAFTPSVTATDVANATTPAATTTTDPSSIFTAANAFTVNLELQIANTFLENAVVGEPYAATFSIKPGDIGIGGPYKWCLGTIASANCTAGSGGITGVSFVNPSPAISDDPPVGGLTNRGYYYGTPTTPQTGTATAATYQVSDLGNTTTPGCSFTGTPTCPSVALAAANAPKVVASKGFVANYASNAGQQGDNLLLFDTNFVNSSTWLTLDPSPGGGNPVVPRVTPDGQWVYVTKQGNQLISVVDATTGLKAINDISVSDVGTFNPTGLDIEPQRYLTANPNSCTTHCSNLNPFIRYDAYLTDPTDGSQNSAKVEPIPDAENPGALPATLVSGNALTVANANNLAISADGTQGFLSLNYLPSGTACGVPPCNTLAVLSLPAVSATLATAYPPTLKTTFNTFGLRAGAVAVDPRGRYVATATRDNTGTYTYITVTSTGATPAFVTYIPTTAGPTSTVNVCSASGVVFTPVAAVPTAITISPDGNRLFVSCLDTATPQVNDTVGVWDISGTSMGVPFIQSIALPASYGAPVVNAENGCTTPVDIKAKLTHDGTTSSYGTRLFVSCQDSDSVVPIDYNTVIDSANIYASAVSTDGSVITNATLGNTTAAYTTYACNGNGSCPQLLDLMPNPSIHFTTGGYAPSIPFALPAASIAAGSYQYYVVAQGGAVPRTFTETTAAPVLLGAGGSGACRGFSLSSSGLISGTPTNTGTCGPFTIRVTDGSTPGQFVERQFTITVYPTD